MCSRILPDKSSDVYSGSCTAFCLTCVLANFWHSIWHLIWHTFWSHCGIRSATQPGSYWHVVQHSSDIYSCQCTCKNFWLACGLTYHSDIQIWHSIWHLEYYLKNLLTHILKVVCLASEVLFGIRSVIDSITGSKFCALRSGTCVQGVGLPGHWNLEFCLLEILTVQWNSIASWWNVNLCFRCLKLWLFSSPAR